MADSQRRLSKTFLQILLDCRYLAVPDVKLLANALNQKYDYDLSLESDAELLDFIGRLNQSLSALHLKLTLCIDEGGSHKVLVLCNTLSSDLSRNPSFNDQQMALFRQIVQLIVASPTGSLTLDQAECAVVDIANCHLSVQQAKNTVEQLIKQKYLRHVGENVTLTPSALMELQPYISASFPDQVLSCFGCNSLCLQGQRCPNNSCNARVHHFCAETVFRRNRTCRVCKCDWDSDRMSE